MRILAALAVALCVAAALADGPPRPQGRSGRGAADGGTARVRTPGPYLLGTDPPGKLRPQRAEADAGTPVPRIAASEEVQRELQQLRGRVEALEQGRAQLQQQSQQLGEVMRQLQVLRAQLAEGEQKQAAAQKREQAQREQRESGVSALRQAQAALAGGDSAVEDQLALAQATFPPQAQRDIDGARTALRNRDLSAARAWLDSAIAHAQQGQER